MTNDLTGPMLRVLQVMADGHDAELDSGDGSWIFLGRLAGRPHNATMEALRRRGMVKSLPRKSDWPWYVQRRYRITDAGREAVGDG